MQFRKIILISIIAILSGVFSIKAQNVSDLIISEVELGGDPNGIIDNYGNRNGWVEIYNTSNGTVNLGGCFLSDNRNNLKKNIIPKGDLKTKIGPRQAIILFADGNNKLGTFYLNFKIRKGSTLYLISNDGRTIVDSLYVNENLPLGKSISKIPLDNKHRKFGIAKDFTVPSPGVANGQYNNESKSQRMKREDPYGLILSIVAIIVVFIALVLLWLLFAGLFGNKEKKAKNKTSNNKDGEIATAISMALNEEFSGDIYAAIAMALYEYNENSIHDKESFIITIKHNQNSNWNNKELSFRKPPRKS